MTRLLPALLAAALLAGCSGHGGVDLTIEGLHPSGAELAIPGEVDELHLSVLPDGEGAEPLLDTRYPLSAERHRFPLTLRLLQGDQTPDRIRIRLEATLAGAEVASAESLVPIDPQEVTTATLRLVSAQ